MTDELLQRMARASTWDADAKTAQVVLSTDADVGDGFILEHSREAIRWPERPIPVVLDHRREVAAVAGAVSDLQLQRTEGGGNALVGTLTLDGPAAAQAEPLLRTGAARWSIGARVHEIRRDVGQQIARAVSWSIGHLALVVEPADMAAITRSVHPETPMENVQPIQDPPIEGDQTVTREAAPAPAPAPAPTPVPVAAVSPEDAELKRELKIRRAAMAAGLSEDKTAEILRSGVSVDDAQIQIVRELRIRHEGADQGAIAHPARVTVTRDSGDTLMRGIEAGLTARVMPGKAGDKDLAREYRSYTLLELTRMYLENRGVNTRGMTKTELVTRGFHSTSDFPLLFSNLAGKSLDAAYQEEPHTWRPLARQRNLPDFKNASDLVVAGDLTPEPLLEGGEYKAGTLQEAQHQWKLATYARRVTVSRQAIINDDLSALERVPELLGRGFRRLESNMIWELITGNAVTSVDGLQLFHGDHNNTGGNEAIGVEGFNLGRQTMRKQTDIAGNRVNLAPNYMIVPTDLEATALQFLYPTGFAPAARIGEDGPVTVQTAGIQLIVEPRLDDSATTWYLAAGPGAVEGIVYGYLAGEEGPTVTTTEKRDPDGVELLARFDFGCAVKDYRFIYRNLGD